MTVRLIFKSLSPDLVACHSAFCVPGVALVVLMQWGDYRGLGGSESHPLSRTSGLPVLPTFVGSLLALPGMFVTHRTPDGTALRRLFDQRMLLIAATFIAGEVCNQASIILAGSLTFTVVYSSVTIWTAAIGIPLLHKRPNATQMLALVLIVAGLACSVLLHGDGTAGTESNNGDIPQGGSAGSADSDTPEDKDSSEFILGAAAGICGALSYALCYVITELVQKADDAPPPEALCVFLGMIGTPVVGIWVVSWAGPDWQHMVADELDDKTPFVLYAAVYGAIIVLAFAHNLAFFYLTKLSAVMAGINKAVQAVSVFAASHIFFCSVDKNQCLTLGKGVSMVLVVCGVLLFSFAKKSVSKQAAAAVPLRRSVSREENAGGENSGVDEGDGLRISNLQKYAELRAGSPTTLHIVPRTQAVSDARM